MALLWRGTEEKKINLNIPTDWLLISCFSKLLNYTNINSITILKTQILLLLFFPREMLRQYFEIGRSVKLEMETEYNFDCPVFPPSLISAFFLNKIPIYTCSKAQVFILDTFRLVFYRLAVILDKFKWYI